MKPDPRYVVQDSGWGEPHLRWWAHDFRTGRPARKDDGTYVEFATRREAYEWLHDHQEPLDGRP